MPCHSLHLGLGLAVFAQLACGPHRGTAESRQPLAAVGPSGETPGDVAAAVPSSRSGARLPEPVRPKAARREPSISATPIAGDTAIDVGNGRSVRVAPDGEIRLGDLLLLPGGGVGVPRFYERARVGDDTVIVVGFGFDTAPNDPGYVVAARIDGRVDKAKWLSWIHAQRIDGGADTDWRLLIADQRVVLMQNERVMALDAATGAQAWVFSGIDPHVSDGYLGGVTILKTNLRMLDVSAESHRLVVAAVDASTDEPLTVELDLATGKRVYARITRNPTPALPLFAFTKVMAPWIGHDDPPAPRPDPPPSGFDGVRVGYAALLWSTKTGHGIIVNPTHDASADVIAAARSARFTDRAGHEAPVKWTMVIDTAAVAAATTTKRGAPPTRTSKPRPDQVRSEYTYGFGTMQTGEVVDLDPVANALGAVAVRSYADLPAKRHGVDVVQVPGDLPELHVEWGPVAFVDDPASHVLVFVQAM